MKGTIQYCLEESIIAKYGDSKWEKCLESCGYPKDFSFMTMIRDDIDEEKSIEIFVKSAETLDIPLKKLFDVFGEYWSCIYAPKLYAAFFAGIKSTRSALTKLDKVHQMVTKSIPNARPPRFIYNWLGENKLELDYLSERGLIELFMSLIKGLNKSFNDTCEITKMSETKLIIEFSEAE